MKIGSIVPYTYLPYQSGGQKYITEFYEFFGEKVEVHVIGTKRNDKALVKKYTFYPVLSSSILRYVNIFLFFEVRNILKEKKIKIVIFEHPYFPWLMWLLSKTGFKIILHTHNIESLRFRSINKWWWPILELYERWAFKQSDLVFFISGEDMYYAIKKRYIASDRSYVIPFGIRENKQPVNKSNCNLILKKELGIPLETALLLFTGHYGYQPNINAVENIITNIAPILYATWTQPYKIVITGKDLPVYLQEKIKQRNDIIYLGFVENIDIFFKGANIFLNTVLTGGGVKTKLIEAIGFGTTVISTVSGALGADKALCSKKLYIAEDYNWELFASLIMKYAYDDTPTSKDFYNNYHWENIVVKAISIINRHAQQH